MKYTLKALAMILLSLLAINLVAANGHLENEEFVTLALPLDGTWHQFNWDNPDLLSDPVPAFESFVFSSVTSVKLSVTDFDYTGDEYRVSDNGNVIGTTSPSIGGLSKVCPPEDIETCFNDPDYSSGVFIVGPGSHLISFETIDFCGSQGLCLYGFGQIKAELIIDAGTAGELEDAIEEMNLPNGVANSLLAQLSQVEQNLSDGNPNNNGAACSKLNNFLNKVQEYLNSGDLTPAQATDLTAVAQALQAFGNCV